ncbi:MAG: hypothetical protein KC503_19265 [Myxococcales bacterium]|nr:hypothetical protein [Myxococcales bacterium]
MKHSSRPLLSIAITWLLLAAMLGASGCNSVKLAYRFVDTALEKVVDPYLADDASKRVAAQEIDRFKLWLKKGVMPDAAAALEQVGRPLALGQLDRAGFARWFASLAPLWNRVARQVSVHSAIVLERHTSSTQLAHLRRAMRASDQKRLAKMRRPRVERLRDRTKRTVKTFERFSGNFEKRQWPVVWLQHERLLESPEHWLRNQRLRQRALLAFLATHPARAQIRAFVERLLTRPAALSEPGYAAFARAQLRGTEAMLFNIVASMTAQQRAMLALRLLALAKDLRELSRS